jgi:hypothetical protein
MDKPCRSPYCECDVGKCTHPGFFDCRGGIKAGADINAGDGGYSVGTQEAYEEFVKLRNEAIALAKKEGIKERHYTNSGKPIDFP